jgi:deoxyribose-phosphate aldolase
MKSSIPAAMIRTPRDLAPFLDHTLLAPGATAEDLARACAEARAHGFGAVCLYPAAVPAARAHLAGSGVRVAAVVDFPRGEAATEARVREARAAASAGADELDLVAPLPALAAGRWEAVLEDLAAVIGAVTVPVKVILETARLSRDAKVAAAAIACRAGAAFVKTSTGFGGGGATVDDVALLRRVVGEGVGVKASGGIRSAADALAMVRAGASCLGASASVTIVAGSF